ncbi:hypothetical protein VTO42DRAFT_426 [Malbranchea cinnamomea]
MPESHLLSSLPSLPPAPPVSSEEHYDQEIRNLRATLKQIPLGKVIAESPKQASIILDSLDPGEQSLTYLSFLVGHYQMRQTGDPRSFPETLQPGGDIWSKAVLFLKTFDSIQIRYAGHELVFLVDMIAAAAESVSKPFAAVHSIKEALLRIDPSCSTFTSTHTTFVRLCLRSKAYVAALPILEKSITHIPGQCDLQYLKRSQVSWCHPHSPSVAYITPSSGLSGKLNYRHYLEYFLYGSMIYIGLKRWDDALHFLQIVISAPTNNSVSMIMVQAYKKWVLVSLIAKGTTLSLPETTSPQAVKLFKLLGRPYDLLADIFQSGSSARLKAEVDAGKSVWSNDRNTGLVFQVMEAYRTFSISGIKRTFAALSVNDIPRVVAEEQADMHAVEMFAVRLIRTKLLDAHLVQSTHLKSPTILRFLTYNPQRNLSSEMGAVAFLAIQKNSIQPLTWQVHEMDAKFELNNEYIDSVKRVKRRKETNKDAGVLMQSSHGGVYVEEDIMAEQ